MVICEAAQRRFVGILATGDIYKFKFWVIIFFISEYIEALSLHTIRMLKELA